MSGSSVSKPADGDLGQHGGQTGVASPDRLSTGATLLHLGCGSMTALEQVADASIQAIFSAPKPSISSKPTSYP